MESTDRLTTPLVRRTPCGRFESVSWVRAIHEFVSRMKSIQAQYGPDSIAVLNPGQLCTEELALLDDLMEAMQFGSLCALGGFTPFPVRSALKHWPEDFGE